MIEAMRNRQDPPSKGFRRKDETSPPLSKKKETTTAGPARPFLTAETSDPRKEKLRQTGNRYSPIGPKPVRGLGEMAKADRGAHGRGLSDFGKKRKRNAVRVDRRSLLPPFRAITNKEEGRPDATLSRSSLKPARQSMRTAEDEIRLLC